MSKTATYAVVTPVRNEEQYLPLTIRSMLAQTIEPLRWIIVNDGSIDRTQFLAEQAAETHKWISVIKRPDRGMRKAGGGVVEAFNEGYRVVEPAAWDYLVKLDGDLSFAPDYFERCFEHFEAEERLGIAGGAIEPESRNDPRFHVRGATKVYRAACWRQMGGLHPAPGWDTLDELKANMLGWQTRTFPELQLQHHRPTGDADGTWANWVKNGRANYITGYLPLFMGVKCLARVPKKPYGIAALGLMCGYASGYVKRLPRIQDPELIRYLRREQMKRLLFQSSLWD